MKKTMKVFTSLVLVLALALSFSAVAFADDGEILHNGKDDTTFEPGSEYTETDLFDNFKGLMPGDSVSQDIHFRNRANYCDYIKVYMRAVPHDEQDNPLSPNVAKHEDVASMTDFLSQLSMKVYKGDEVLYDASPDELDGFKENVYLGKIKRGHSASLRVELNVPIELGNEYANRVGEVDWVFVFEGHNNPDKPEPVVPVKPGDVLIQTGQLNWPVAVFASLGAALVLLGIFFFVRKKKDDEDNLA